MTTRLITALGLATLLAAALGQAAPPAASPTPAAPPASPATAPADAPALPQDDTTVISGQIEPGSRVEVPSVLRGQLVSIAVKEGQPIARGQPIAQLDDTIQKQTVALARLEADSTVEIRSAEANVAHARNDLERYRGIAESAQSAFELRLRELAVKQAELKLEQSRETAARKKLDLAREEATLEKMTIRAPIDGMVLRVNREAGELVELDKPVAVIVQTSKLHARFYPPKQLFGKVKVGDKVTLELRTDPPAARTATVIAVDPVLDVASQLFQVKMELDNPDGTVPAGTAANWTWTPPAVAGK